MLHRRTNWHRSNLTNEDDWHNEHTTFHSNTDCHNTAELLSPTTANLICALFSTIQQTSSYSDVCITSHNQIKQSSKSSFKYRKHTKSFVQTRKSMRKRTSRHQSQCTTALRQLEKDIAIQIYLFLFWKC